MGTGGVLALAVGVLATALLVGCGSESSSDETISKKAFIKQANAICRAAKKEGRKKTPGQGTVTLSAILEIELNKIEALGTPADGGEKIEKMLDEMRETIAIIGNDQGNARDAGPPFLNAESIASDYGIDSCLVA
jgi:hypothetical protein